MEITGEVRLSIVKKVQASRLFAAEILLCKNSVVNRISNPALIINVALPKRAFISQTAFQHDFPQVRIAWGVSWIDAIDTYLLKDKSNYFRQCFRSDPCRRHSLPMQYPMCAIFISSHCPTGAMLPTGSPISFRTIAHL